MENRRFPAETCDQERISVRELRQLFKKYQIPYDAKDKKATLLQKLDQVCRTLVVPNQCDDLVCSLQQQIPHDINKLTRTTGLANAVLQGYSVRAASNEIEEARYKSVLEKTTDFFDPTQELKDIMTNLTNNYFLRDQNNVARYIKLVTQMANSAIAHYRKSKGLKTIDIVFIYKGGNALKAIFLKYMNELPGVSADQVYQTFHKYFKKSDADFQIYINPKLDNWDEIYDDMISLSYLVTNRIRMILQLYATDYFDFYQYHDDMRANILQTTLKELNQAKILQDRQLTTNKWLKDYKYLYKAHFLALRFRQNMVFNSKYGFDPQRIVENQPELIMEDASMTQKAKFEKYATRFHRADLFIQDDPQDPDQKSEILTIDPLYQQGLNSDLSEHLKLDLSTQESIDQISQGNEMFISVNKSIRYQRASYIQRFALIRMKCNFTAFFKTPDNKYGVANIPGELIDISISHRDDVAMHKFFDNIRNHFNTYKYVGRYGIDQEFIFKSYSVEYYIADLHKMLFWNQKYPWQIEKYEKRLYRVFFLYLIDLYRVLGPHKSLELLQDFIGSFKHKSQKDFTQALTQTQLYQRPDLEMHFFLNKLLEFSGIEETVENYTDYNFRGTETKQFLTNIVKIVDDMIVVTQNLLQFIKTGKISKIRLLHQHEL